MDCMEDWDFSETRVFQPMLEWSTKRVAGERESLTAAEYVCESGFLEAA